MTGLGLIRISKLLRALELCCSHISTNALHQKYISRTPWLIRQRKIHKILHPLFAVPLLQLKVCILVVHVQNLLCPDRGPDAQYCQPEVALRNIRRDLIEQVAFPADVVVHIHDADHNVHNPDHKEDDPICLA